MRVKTIMFVALIRCADVDVGIGSFVDIDAGIDVDNDHGMQRGIPPALVLAK